MKIGLLLNNKVEARPTTGMDLYRMIFPYYPIHNSEGFECHMLSMDEFDMNPLTCDVYVINRSRELFRAQRVKAEGKKLIIDVDDYWHLPKWHPISPDVLTKALKIAREHPEKRKDIEAINAAQRILNVESTAPFNIEESIRIADHVTCSVPQLADKIRLLNPNVTVVKNTIPSKAIHYTPEKSRSRFLRFGWLGGTYHFRDVSLMFDGITKLHRDQTEKGKYQFLSSFNVNSEYMEIEKIFTCNYRFVSPQYREHLTQFSTVASHLGLHEPYRRVFGVPVEDYGSLYRDVDVSLIPLKHGVFNSMKSELKLVEAGSTGCAAIVSDVLPYKPYLKDKKNCLKVSGSMGWYTAFKMLINNRELVKDLRAGLAETISAEFDNLKESEKIKQILTRWTKSE